MRTHRSFIAAVILALIVAGGCLDARAEVAAETDFAGAYVRTVVVTSASVSRLKIWSVEGLPVTYHPLNPGGDLNGDLWPVIVENPNELNYPWVVWSRYTGSGYDLAWSRWLSGGWTKPAWVEEAADASAGDDLDPSLTFDAQGQPYLAWWRGEGGIGRVYFSTCLGGSWTAAYPVSDEGVDSRTPEIAVLDGGQIEVYYDTPEGPVIRNVVLYVPLTITDDIDPIGQTGVTSVPSAGPRGGSNR